MKRIPDCRLRLPSIVVGTANNYRAVVRRRPTNTVCAAWKQAKTDHALRLRPPESLLWNRSIASSGSAAYHDISILRNSYGKATGRPRKKTKSSDTGGTPANRYPGRIVCFVGCPRGNQAIA